jgi:hypothetical protein
MNLEEELKKAGVYPVSMLVDKKDGKLIFRVQGTQKALKKFFQHVYDWKLYSHGEDEEISYYGEAEGFVLLDKDDPRIPTLKRMALELFIEKLEEKDEERAKMLNSLKDHFSIEIKEYTGDIEIAIDPYIEGFCLAVDPELFDSPTLMTWKEDIEIDESTPIEEVIKIIKKAVIEK